VLRHIFISYAHSREDDTIAFRIVNLIEAAGRRVWLDRLNLREQSGGSLNTKIAEAIASAHVLVLVQSGYALASAYVQAENICAMEVGIPILRIEVEPCALPPQLMPLSAHRGLRFHAEPRANWDRLVFEALSELGIRMNPPARFDPLITPSSRVVRPPYASFRGADAGVRRSILARLLEAMALSPANGYNSLSLAFIRLSLGDFAGAARDADEAVRLLPLEGEASYARALIAVAGGDLKTMFHNRAQEILQDLARARRLPDPGAHVDVLSAIVISGHYLANSKTPPAPPAQLLAMARQPEKCLYPDEIQRILDLVPVADPGLRAEIVRLAATPRR
jgi:hypothetical protein